MMTQPSHEEIAKRAYDLYEAGGRADGNDLRDWFEAERALGGGQQAWRLSAPKESLTSDADDAVLMLRLGIAVNAMRSAQRFYDVCKDLPGPAGERDRLWAFLVALGFLHEAIQNVLRADYPTIAEYARAAGASDELAKEAASLLSGKNELGRILTRMRNTLIFHWDRAPIQRFAQAFDPDEVAWADGVGVTSGEAVYRAAADAVADSIFPDEPGSRTTSEETGDRIRELMREVLRATRHVFSFFDLAIAGFLRGQKAKLTR